MLLLWGGHWVALCPPFCCCGPPKVPAAQLGEQIWGGWLCWLAPLYVSYPSGSPTGMPPCVRAAFGVDILRDSSLHWQLLWAWDHRGSGNPKVCPASVSPSIMQELQGKVSSSTDNVRWMLGTGSSVSSPTTHDLPLAHRDNFCLLLLKIHICVYKCSVLAVAVPQHLLVPQTDGIWQHNSFPSPQSLINPGVVHCTMQQLVCLALALIR